MRCACTTRPENLRSLRRFVGRTPWSAADAPVGLVLVAAMLLCGAGASACQPSARPSPILGATSQPRINRIVFDIPNNTIQFEIIPHAMVKRFILPKGRSGSSENEIGLSRGRTFHPARNYGKRSFWKQQHVHMIGHDHPSPKLIEPPPVLAVQKCICHHTCDPRVPQPNRPKCGPVHLAIRRHKRLPSRECRCGSGSGAGASACQPPHKPTPRHRPSQSPSDK